jgi:hypothetical protein
MFRDVQKVHPQSSFKNVPTLLSPMGTMTPSLAQSPAIFMGSPSLSASRRALMTPTGQTRTSMDSKMLKYAKVVHALNEHSKKQQPYGLISSFTEVAAATEDRDAVLIQYLQYLL